MDITKNDLINYFLNTNKPTNNIKIGIELEHFLCDKNNLMPFNIYKIQQLVTFFPVTYWKKSYSNNVISGLSNSKCNISFEPGLQIEFSSLPERNLHLLKNSYELFLRDLNYALREINGTYFAIGYHPFLSPEQTPFLGGERYKFMYNYMPKVGTLGRNMMKNTTTTQTNIDYTSYEDLQKKIQVLANITPFLIYFSASSPFKENTITPFLSYRNHVWEDTDKVRCCMPEFYFNQQFSIEKYVDYLLNIPLYFVIRNNKFIFNSNQYTFLDLMQSKVKNIHATLEDFILHISTVFPYVRLKTYLEIRCCDTMGADMPLAISALIVGIVYNSNSLEEIYNITKNWSKDTFLELKHYLNTQGLTSETINGINLINFATHLLNVSYNGLKERHLNEEIYLEPLFKILETRTNLAQEYIKLYKKHNNIKEFIKHISILNNTNT